MKISICQRCKKEPILIEETLSFVISCGECGQRVWNDTTLNETVLMWNRAQKRLGPMTNDDLVLARMLFTTACEASSWASTMQQQFDEDTLVDDLLTLTTRAQIALRHLCGRHFDLIGDRDLNDENLAPWTQLPYHERHK